MSLVREYAIGIIAAIGFVSAVVSLLTTRWSDVTGAMRVRRSLLVLTLLIAAVLAAIVSMPLRSPAPVASTTAQSIASAKDWDRSPRETALTVPRPIAEAANVAPEPVSTPVSAPARRLSALPPTIRAADGRSVSELMLVAERAVDTSRHDVDATLTANVTHETDERLKGMITVGMSLDVIVTTRGARAAAFRVTSRGGGYTEAHAEQQAYDRLVTAFDERLRKEIPR